MTPMNTALHQDPVWMQQKYVEHQMSAYQISDLTGVPKSTVDNWLRKLGIPVRSKTVANKLRSKVPGDDPVFLDGLRNNYLQKRMSASAIGVELGLSESQTSRLLERAGVVLRQGSEALTGRKISNRARAAKKADVLQRDTLVHLYHSEKLSTYQIAEMYALAPCEVLGRMRELNVHSRTKRESIYLRAELLDDLEITPELQEVLEGELLGDGCLVRHSERSACFAYGTSKLEYATWLRNRMDRLGLRSGAVRDFIRTMNGRNYVRCEFDSRAHASLLALRQRWYPGGKKVVPNDLVLTPTMCLHWYIGDGHFNKRDKFINIATQGFTLDEVAFLVEQLRDRIGDARIWKSQHGHGAVVGVLRRFVPGFLEYIGPCPPALVDVYGYKWGGGSP